MNLRQITPDTIDSAVLLGAAWAEQWSAEFDIEPWRASIRNYAIYFDHYARIITDALDRPRGFALGAVRAIPHTGQRLAELQYIYLDPELQELDNMVAVLQDFELWGNQFDIDSIEIRDLAQRPGWYSAAYAELGFESDQARLVKGTR